ncbi:MAG: PIN domain-containing protein [Lentisphaerae bacterium]|nr:PIN domain-containing protein [Lentisphaerota bacterium]
MSEGITVLDASALLALLHEEAGAGTVETALLRGGVVMSTVNYAEVVGCLARWGISGDGFRDKFRDLGIELMGLDEPVAFQAGVLKAQSRSLGLSLGDCACLALAKHLSAKALTADAAWTSLQAEYKVETIR